MPARKKLKRKRKQTAFKNVIFSFVTIIIIFVVFIGVYIYGLISKNERIIIPIVSSHTISEGMLDHISIPDEIELSDVSGTESIAEEPIRNWGSGRVDVYVNSDFPIIFVEKEDPNIENFLVFGVDARTAGSYISRADSIIIVTIDNNTNSIKLTSIMRDTQVVIPGRTEPGKINASYVYGGVGLLINTINQNFGLDIQKFAMFDFWSAESIIDGIGGIDIEITEDERVFINSQVAFANYIFRNVSEASQYLSTAGLVTLNGRQSVSYGRIRKIGNDMGRTQRQRKVFSAVMNKFGTLDLTERIGLLDNLASSFETNITKADMVMIAIDAFPKIDKFTQYRIPANGMFTTNTDNWNLIMNTEIQLPALHEFIWGDTISHVTPAVSETSSDTSSVFESDSSEIISNPVSSQDTSESSSDFYSLIESIDSQE